MCAASSDKNPHGCEYASYARNGAEVDTACSSSLVSSNLLFNYLRKRPVKAPARWQAQAWLLAAPLHTEDPSVKEAITTSHMTCLAPGGQPASA